ncbi:MAG TPA: leucine-rich repeat domain-containing protein [Candidatus Negativibacillus faecipullorum]|nr:leucine-rich repeat domain-containing protein [Candidatus Negativibacillus faecipullorum]
MKERWQKISALALAAALTLLGGVQVFADGEQAPLTVGQSGPQPVLLMAASAETGTDGLQYSYHTDNTATVSGYTGTATEVVIPAEVTHEDNTYKVTAIGGYAFLGDFTLTNVIIPEGVTEIAYYAFAGCTSLTNVTIPEGVTYIGDLAFDSCTSLTSVTIPEGVTHIGNRAFWGCKSLTSVSLPASLTECGEAFYRLNLTKVTFATPQPPRFIVGGEGEQPAFQGATIEQIQLPEGADEQEWREALGRAKLNNAVDEIRIIIGEATPPTPDPTPTTPPADNNTAESTSAPAVQQMEQRERPDPQDIEATERYNFWMGVKVDLRAAADGERLRVHVPADYTNMPASVMEQIRLLDEDIVVDLRWNGQRLLITPATAQQKTALKAYWTFDQLCELYAQAQFESM